MTLADRKTPETDAAVVSAEFIRREMDHYKHKFILADHARRLERERDAAVEALKYAADYPATPYNLGCYLRDVLAEIEGKS